MTAKRRTRTQIVSGSARIGGVDYWISGWLKKDKNGKPYLSLAFKPKHERVDRSKPLREDLNDQVPF
jgi:hypothetical protein